MADFDSRRIEAAALTALVSGCPSLERLLLAGCHVTDSAGLRQLAGCAALRHLDMSRVTTERNNTARPLLAEADPAPLAAALSGCPLLERLLLANTGLTHLEQLVPDTGLPRLTLLDVSGTGLTSNSLRRIPQLFPNLNTLHMANGRSVKSDALTSYLPRLRRLCSLDIRGISSVTGVSSVTGAVLEALKGCGLAKLRLSCNENTGKELVRLVSALVSLRFLEVEVAQNYAKTVHEMLSKQKLGLHRVMAVRLQRHSPILAGHVLPRVYHEQSDPAALLILTGEDSAAEWDWN